MSQCHHFNINSSVCQSLDELDFERGIWSAAQNNDITRALTLIRKGINVNATDKAGYTALHYASRNGHLEMCKLLLSNDANVNLVTRAGKASSLHRSATAGHVDIFKILLESGAEIGLKDSDGKTVLHRATEADHEDIVEAILEVEPRLARERDNKGELPVDLAKSDAVRTLLSNIEVAAL